LESTAARGRWRPLQPDGFDVLHAKRVTAEGDLAREFRRLYLPEKLVGIATGNAPHANTAAFTEKRSHFLICHVDTLVPGD
jgi:hypothetical protein